MRAVVQRVRWAQVTVNNEVVSRIEKGLCALIGLGREDNAADADYIVRKLLNVRIFEGEDGKKWDKSLSDLSLELLCVSQFTLHAFCKGNKLDFHLSKGPTEASEFYKAFIDQLRTKYKPELVKDGLFGAYMQVTLENDGPVTLFLDSRDR
ncbi:Tyr Deacylase domain containing protein [Trichuris trichiura]|uniref:D-aminoacyl-tRNA deacylase n=1 Tax=Trichuris trichiura TaxID=36087 RepID=A0A077ZCW6_TRITR|nr:Tyr Deacylase domain containing protein [Trichuris trichiura]